MRDLDTSNTVVVYCLGKPIPGVTMRIIITKIDTFCTGINQFAFAFFVIYDFRDAPPPPSPAPTHSGTDGTSHPGSGGN